ncbi:MAG: hypothetical protein LBP59_12675 [Planctomycetaceae bacterium]|jgi:hypothetical protein|nr:hypothetical protein [Planctomycetaceae bacterium]
MSTQNVNEPLDKTIDSRIESACKLLFKTEFWLSILILLVFIFSVLFLAALADQWFAGGLSVTLRALIFFGVIIFASFFIYRRIVPLFLYPINPVYAAQILENNSASAKNAIINWVTLKRERIVRGRVAADKLGEKMLEGLTLSAAENINAITPERIINKTGINICIATLVIIVTIFILYSFFSPKNLIQSFARIALPFVSIDPPQAVKFVDIEPRNATALQGEHLTISAKVIGKSKSPVYVFFSTDDGRAVKQAVPMSRTSNGDASGNFWKRNESVQFETPFPPGKQGFICGTEYWIQQDDSKSDTYRVEVRPVATVEIESLTYKYPDYTGLQDEVVRNSGDIKAVSGTEVTLQARSTAPLEQADIVYDKKNEQDDSAIYTQQLKMKIDSENATIATAIIPLKLKPQNKQTPNNADYENENISHFTINATDKDGFKSRRSGMFRQEIIKDKKPLIQWSDEAISLKEAAQVDLPLNAEIMLGLQAEDPDFALRYLRIKYKVTAINKKNKQIRQSELLQSPITGATKHKGQIKKNIKFKPQQFQLNIGDTVEVWGEAVDTKLPEPNVAETRHITIKIVKQNENNNNNKNEDKEKEKNKDKEKDKDKENNKNKEQQNKQKNNEKQDTQNNNQEANENNNNENNNANKTNEKSTDNAENKNNENKNNENNENKNNENNDNKNDKQNKPIDPETQSADAMQKIVDQMKKDNWKPESEPDKNKENEKNKDQNQNQDKDQNQDKQNNNEKKNPEKNTPEKKQNNQEQESDQKNNTSPQKNNLDQPNETSNAENKQGEQNNTNSSQDKNKTNKNKDDKNAANKPEADNSEADNPEQNGDNSKNNNKNDNNNNKNNNDNLSKNSNKQESENTKNNNPQNETNQNQNTQPQKNQNNNEKNNNPEKNKNNADNENNNKNNSVDKNDNVDKDENKTAKNNSQSDNITKKEQPVDPDDKTKRERTKIDDPKQNNLQNNGNDPSNPQETNLKNNEKKQLTENKTNEKTDKNLDKKPDEKTGEKTDGNKNENENGNEKEGKNKTASDDESKSKENNKPETGKNNKSESGKNNKTEPEKNNLNNSDGKNVDSSNGNASDKSTDKPKPNGKNNPTNGNTGRGGIGNNNNLPEAEAERREFTERNVNLALDYLEDQLNKGRPSGELLKELGWTEDQLREFHKKWKTMADNAKQIDNGQKSNEAWENALKSFNIRPSGTDQKLRKNKTTIKDNIKKSQSTNLMPPKKLQQKYQKYTEAISGKN